MNILAINNYSLEENLKKSNERISPRHHNWGVDYLRNKGHNIKLLNYKQHGKRDLFGLWFCIRLLPHLNHFDVIIAFANPIIGWLAFLKKIGLVKPRIYTLVHHCNGIMMLGGGYEKILFLSKEIMQISKNRYPHLAKKMFYIEWGPDLPFYESTYQSMAKGKPTQIRLISNGKTSRDLSLVTSACSKMHVPVIVITDKVSEINGAIVSGTKGKNALSYKDTLGYMKLSSISLIPIVSSRPKQTLCGLTSLLDALALGQPVIMSDNTNISVDIEKEEIGLLYKAGDESDFTCKVKNMLDHPELVEKCGRNARLYAERHSYLDYCKSLEYLITE